MLLYTTVASIVAAYVVAAYKVPEQGTHVGTRQQSVHAGRTPSSTATVCTRWEIPFSHSTSLCMHMAIPFSHSHSLCMRRAVPFSCGCLCGEIEPPPLRRHRRLRLQWLQAQLCSGNRAMLLAAPTRMQPAQCVATKWTPASSSLL